MSSLSKTHLCPYVPEKGFIARESGFMADELPEGLYTALMDQGYRRSGNYFYRTQCLGCQDCRQLRLSVETFLPNRAQKRNLVSNADLTIIMQDPQPTTEKFQLYLFYLNARHGGREQTDSYEHFVQFFYTSPIKTKEVLYYFKDKLIGVGLLDLEKTAVSSVYCYYDPNYRARGLGTLNILWTLEFCRKKQLHWYYLGYFIEGCSRMDYKKNFRPHELLIDGQWFRFPEKIS